jgi:hypothetical protein
MGCAIAATAWVKRVSDGIAIQLRIDQGDPLAGRDWRETADLIVPRP